MKAFIMLLSIILTTACSQSDSKSETLLSHTQLKKSVNSTQIKTDKAQQQYELAISLQSQADPNHIKQSQFYYWLSQSAKNGYPIAKSMLQDIDADYEINLTDEFAPNNSQKIMDEISDLQKSAQPNYQQILELLYQAVEQQNFIAIMQLSRIYASEDEAALYQVAISPLKACTLQLYANNIYGDINKDEMSSFCSGQLISEKQFQHAEDLAKKIEHQPKEIKILLK